EAEIVWQWKLYDHMVQDIDSTKNNFGVISEHPELIDINSRNFQGGGSASADWFHMNSVNYNAELDQIIFSSRSLNEIYIIDHSTSIEEAAGHTGGIAGKGGDILFRWGNPRIYHRGGIEDQRLYGQHDAHWIPGDRPGGGNLMIFNNGSGRPEGNFSTIEVVQPPLNGFNYNIPEGEKYGPEDALWTFEGAGNTEFYSSRISGAQRQPNGNTLICSGNQYRIFEVDPAGNLVWDYINPVNQNGALSQGSSSSSRDMFRAYRYSPDYPAFEGKDLIPGDPLESNPQPYLCNIYDITTSVNTLTQKDDFQIFPNPGSDIVYISNDLPGNYNLTLMDMTGQPMISYSNIHQQNFELDVSPYPPGVYILRIGNAAKRLMITKP
ncbi:MAG: T9SS type A sorting domain-containing protein, partial [Saprospiraceae bacterium]|nr:T9SS type A sorting domain-containing protein [Saprospiraceae bacterium]